MTILESLRARKAIIDSERIKDENAGIYDLIEGLFLLAENLSLKLKNRGVEIKDLKHRLEKTEARVKWLEGKSTHKEYIAELEK